MDLRVRGQVLYLNALDLSASKAPSTNELEFIYSLHEVLGTRLHVLVPKPASANIDLGRIRHTLYCGAVSYHPKAFIHLCLSQVKQASPLLASGRFDFMVSRLDILPLGLVYLTRKYQVPFAIRSPGLGVLRSLAERGGALGKGLSPLHMVLIRDLVKRSVAIDVPVKPFVDMYRSRFGLDPAKLLCVNNSVNADRFYPLDKAAVRAQIGLAEFDPIVGIVAGNPWISGGVQLIDVAPQLLAKYPSLGVVVAGGGDRIAELKQRVADLGIENHIVFPGMLPYEKVPIYMNAFDVGVGFNVFLPGKKYGSASMKMRQYIACGLPVVSGPGDSIFVERPDLGTVVEIDDLQQIFEAIDDYLALSVAERKVHSSKAAAYARENLSYRKTTQTRLDFWNARLASQLNS